MSTAPITVEPSTPVREVIRLLIERRISGVPVVDEGRVVGIISEGDLILRERAYRQRGGMAFLAQQLFEDHERLALEYRKAHGLVAADVMTCARPDDPARHPGRGGRPPDDRATDQAPAGRRG